MQQPAAPWQSRCARPYQETPRPPSAHTAKASSSWSAASRVAIKPALFAAVASAPPCHASGSTAFWRSPAQRRSGEGIPIKRSNNLLVHIKHERMPDLTAQNCRGSNMIDQDVVDRGRIFTCVLQLRSTLDGHKESRSSPSFIAHARPCRNLVMSKLRSPVITAGPLVDKVRRKLLLFINAR
jgi:hypothetical protein